MYVKKNGADETDTDLLIQDEEQKEDAKRRSMELSKSQRGHIELEAAGRVSIGGTHRIENPAAEVPSK